MTTRKKHKSKKSNNSNNSKKCFIYKSCDHVPCNSGMNKCTPSYCVPGSSRNWGYCNMANWGPLYEKYKHNLPAGGGWIWLWNSLLLVLSGIV